MSGSSGWREKRALALRPGATTIELGPGGEGRVRLRRFAEREYPLDSGAIQPGSTTRLYIPRDRLRRPWRLLVEAGQGALVCRG